MRRVTASWVTPALFALVAAACGSDPSTTSATPALGGTGQPSSTTEPTAATTTEPTAATTTEPAIAATTTEPTAATTTEPAIAATTTLPPTTVLAVGPAGWSAVDRDSLSSKAFPPCCADTWHGDISPAFAPAGQPLADGPYAVTPQWPEDPTQPLELEVFRFDQCALSPRVSCESRPEGYGPDDVGVDTSESRPLAVALDDSVRVVVVGWDDATRENDGFVVEQASGTDFAELAMAVNQAYAEVFADRLLAGEDPNAIIADVLANPTGGFTPAENQFEAFMFTPDNGPPLLFQVVFASVDGQLVAGRGMEAPAIRSIDVVDGQVTVYVYAAYVP